jgi:hypothetical protein
MRSVGGVALLSLLASACGSEDPAVDPNARTAVLRFAITDDTRGRITDPPNGQVYGSVYLKEDVSLTGPRTGAAEQASDINVAVDVRNAATSEGSFRTPAFELGTEYVFLGFFDVDGNGATTRDPDAGDPVTLPITNVFTVNDAGETQVRVLFDLVFN